MTLDLTAHKKRMTIMLSVNAVCVLAALIALFVNFRYQINWISGVFVAALIAGFGAQIWFIMGFRQARRP